MASPRFVPALVAACLAASTACSDTEAPTSRSPSFSTPAFITMAGVLRVTGLETRGAVVLKTTDGEEIPLVGANVAALVRVDSAEVEVRGIWDADHAFDVSDFLVLGVGGAPAMDGVLIDMRDYLGSEVIGYGLRLTRGGIAPLIDPPAELLAHLGARMWVTAATDGPPTTFGIIAE